MPTAATVSKNGWYLVEFSNGDVGVGEYQSGAWEWHGLAPDSSIDKAVYLGGNIGNVLSSNAIETAVIGSGIPQYIISELENTSDAGVLTKGQPVVFKATGTAANNSVGNSGNIVGDVAQAQVIPGALGAGLNSASNTVANAGSFLSLFGSLSFWKGLGLVIAGAGILIFAAIEFKDMI